MSETYLSVVTGVAMIGHHVLRLLFSDGVVGDVDLSQERWSGVLEPLNDPAFFAQVTVDTESGTVTWPGGIDLAPRAAVRAGARPPACRRLTAEPARRWPRRDAARPSWTRSTTRSIATGGSVTG
jgi:hypothetical protein